MLITVELDEAAVSKILSDYVKQHITHAEGTYEVRMDYLMRSAKVTVTVENPSVDSRNGIE